MLLLYGAHDEIIPPAPVRQMIGELPKDTARRSRIAYYDNGYHMLMRDLEAKLVLDDIASWIADRAAPLPSGADRNTLQLLAAGS